MRRDMEIVRRIVISLAERGSPDPEQEINHDVLQYHLWIMQEAGLISDFSRFRLEGGAAIHSLELTWAGNEFLEAARSETIWNKAKTIVFEKTGAASFQVLTAVLVDLAIKAVK